MHDFTITIDCDNAAWFEDAASELAYVLDQVKRNALDMACGSTRPLLDSNGNTTGEIKVSPVNY